jgi:hypothetical protein
MSHRRRNANPRHVIFWAVVGFFGIQLALDVGVVARHPELEDPEYGRRLALLRERMAEAPGRPLVLMIGSSRTQLSFRPELLPPPRTADGTEALVFNFSHRGAGPAMNLVELRRLLRAGIRPDWLVLEIMPSQLGDPGQRILLATANVKDLSVTRHYRNPLLVYGVFARGALVPCYKYRMFLAHEAIPGWVPSDDWAREQIPLGPLGGDFAWHAVSNADAEYVRRATQSAHDSYKPALQALRLVDLSDRATHDLLDLCRRRGIPVVLVLSPEGPLFQSWYSPEARALVDGYCAAVSREYGAPLIDARDWLDEADFLDSHHVATRGAEKFTRRLGREVLQPLVEGKLGADSPR